MGAGFAYRNLGIKQTVYWILAASKGWLNKQENRQLAVMRIACPKAIILVNVLSVHCELLTCIDILMACWCRTAVVLLCVDVLWHDPPILWWQRPSHSESVSLCVSYRLLLVKSLIKPSRGDSVNTVSVHCSVAWLYQSSGPSLSDISQQNRVNWTAYWCYVAARCYWPRSWWHGLGVICR